MVVADLPDPNVVIGRWPTGRLVVFDDREWFRGEAAVIVQPSLPGWAGTARAGRVLAGYAYAPIRAGLREQAAALGREGAGLRDEAAREGNVEVVACFGGSDPGDVTARLAPAVAARLVGSSAADLTVIAGPGYAGSVRPGVGWTLLVDPPDVDARLARATVALIGGGTMELELALLGIPAIVVDVADDQVPVAAPFAQATRAARYVGDGRSVDPGAVAEAVADVLADPAARRSMTEAGRAAVDGRGAERIADAIEDLARA